MPNVTYTNETPVVLLVPNHKRGKSHERMELYKACKTCGEYIAACTKAQGKGYGAADLQWDYVRGFISIGGKTHTPAKPMAVVNPQPAAPTDIPQGEPEVDQPVAAPLTKAQRKAAAKAARAAA